MIQSHIWQSIGGSFSEVVDLATLANEVPGRSCCLSGVTATCEIQCRSQHEYSRDALSVEVREVPGVAGQ